MLKFRGFRASFDFITGKHRGYDHNEQLSSVSICGAYRANTEEFANVTFRQVQTASPQRKFTPSMVQIPNSQYTPPIRPSKSTGDLSQNVSQNNAELSKSTQNVAHNNATKTQIKEQKRNEKRRLEEQKKQERLAVKERQRVEKENKLKEKKEQNRLEKEKKLRQNNNAIQQEIPRIVQQPIRQSTNTLNSSISKSSGPPPYSPPEIDTNRIIKSSNISLARPESESNWNLISDHREQLNRPVASVSNIHPQKLEYNVGNLRIENTNNKTEV